MKTERLSAWKQRTELGDNAEAPSSPHKITAQGPAEVRLLSLSLLFLSPSPPPLSITNS